MVKSPVMLADGKCVPVIRVRTQKKKILARFVVIRFNNRTKFCRIEQKENPGVRNAVNGFQETLQKLPALLEERAFLQWRGRRFGAEMLIEADGTPFHLRFRKGRLEEMKQGPILMRSWDFALRADAASWLAHWQPVPRPGFHDLFAMTKFGHLRIEGDLYPLMTHLQFVKDVLALPREIAGGAQ